MDRFSSPVKRTGAKILPLSVAPTRVDFYSASGETSLLGLGVHPTTTLGDVQRKLCGAFGHCFPQMSAVLVSPGQVYTEFSSLPFLNIGEEASFTVVFEVTSDMRFWDESKRPSVPITCRFPDGESIRFKLTPSVTYDQVLSMLAPYSTPFAPVAIKRPDGTTPAGFEHVEADDIFEVVF